MLLSEGERTQTSTPSELTLVADANQIKKPAHMRIKKGVKNVLNAKRNFQIADTCLLYFGSMRDAQPGKKELTKNA